MKDYEVQHYGSLISAEDILYDGRHITTKLYKYENSLFVELWTDGIRLYFSELFD